MSMTLTDQDKLTPRTAAYGAVSVLAAAGAADAPHTAAADGAIALASAAGLVGHVLAEQPKGVRLTGPPGAGRGRPAGTDRPCDGHGRRSYLPLRLGGVP